MDHTAAPDVLDRGSVLALPANRARPQERLRIAQIAPVWLPVPPPGYFQAVARLGSLATCAMKDREVAGAEVRPRRSAAALANFAAAGPVFSVKASGAAGLLSSCPHRGPVGFTCKPPVSVV